MSFTLHLGDSPRDTRGRRLAIRHGEAMRGRQTAEHRAWSSMVCRCTVPTTTNYKFYGGRGIAVCERWATYENFLADMGRKPTPSHSLDRIDPGGNYEPGNCRWATHIEQCRNRRSTRWIELDGERLSMAAWGQRSGVDQDLISYRLRAGWPARDAVFTPPHGRRK